MKLCKYCGVKRDEMSFDVALIKNGKVYRRLKCHPCKRAQQQERLARIKNWLREFKQTLRCERCGFADWRALDFHHLDREEKSFEVSNYAIRGGSLENLKKEIAKCSVLCANCHRITHFEERETQLGT